MHSRYFITINAIFSNEADGLLALLTNILFTEVEQCSVVIILPAYILC